MTRLWGLHPRLLCRQHLLGEHKEMHQEAGTIENHPHGEAIVRGHAERGQVDTRRIQSRHDELVEEMIRRGMNHDSPLAYEDELGIGEICVSYNAEDLYDRCEQCRERFREHMELVPGEGVVA